MAADGKRGNKVPMAATRGEATVRQAALRLSRVDRPAFAAGHAVRAVGRPVP